MACMYPLGGPRLKLGPVQTNGQREGRGGGGAGRIPRNVQAGERGSVGGGGKRERREVSTCTGSQAALAWIVVALRSLAFTLSFPTLIAR